MKILFAWVGQADLDASAGTHAKGGDGPILGALKDRDFDRVELLYNYNDASKGKSYEKWLKAKKDVAVRLRHVPLPPPLGPMNYGRIYEAAKARVEEARVEFPAAELTLHLSPGTAAMHVAWVLLAAVQYDVKLAQTSKEHGFVDVRLPFDIYADFKPERLVPGDEKLTALAQAPVPPSPEFKEILFKSAEMGRLVERARIVAIRDVPVLIQGDSGTGKELLARAIHGASPRSAGPFIAVNCGAIPSTLVEGTLFGWKKGAFTGADKDSAGLVEAATTGTLFLDEIGEMPLDAQVKLLRVLQEKQVTRVGDTRPRKLDFRVIGATNKSLIDEVARHRFREDLFHRLAVGVLIVPPLAKRSGDIPTLAKQFLDAINKDAANVPGYTPKKLSVNAIKRLMAHSWPGNVRELRNPSTAA